ncbi:MAG TPA: hypothetical protein VGF94_00995 [Kofleriaceae bacterium]
MRGTFHDPNEYTTIQTCASPDSCIENTLEDEVKGTYELAYCAHPDPVCVEPSPGLAFCVDDPRPDPMCDGHDAAPVSVCAYGTSACASAEVAMFCQPDGTAVACANGYDISKTACGAGHCIVPRSLDAIPCE